MSIQQRGRILLVDDDEDVSSGIRELLEQRYQFNVSIARTVKEAMREVVQDRFDVVVLDWILRDGDGREVIRCVREASPDATIVVYSAYPSSDSECTAANADEFVEKSHDTLPLRNAVERGVAQSRRKRLEMSSAERSSNWFADALLDAVGGKAAMEDRHVAIAGTSESVCFDLAVEIARRRSSPARLLKKLDAAELPAEDEHGAAVRLFGECSFSGGMPSLRRGILEPTVPMMLIVRRADHLPVHSQELLAATLRQGWLRRVGSDRNLDVDCRVIVTVAGNAEPLRGIERPLADLFVDSVVLIPRLDQMPRGPGVFLQSLVRRCCGTRVAVSPSIEAVLKILGGSTSLTMLRDAIQDTCGALSDPSGSTFEIEDAGMSLFESLLVKREGTKRTLTKWAEFGCEMKAAYVCRALSEARGNVANAARMTGLPRNAIYAVLRKSRLEAEDFRQSRQGGPFESAVE
jgi:DNA-binding NtrC family response regulator